MRQLRLIFSRTNQDHLDDCVLCPVGYYCLQARATEPTGVCAAGHICYERAESPDPVYNNDTDSNNTVVTYGDQCEAGYYCPAGTSFMIECPIGTFKPL